MPSPEGTQIQLASPNSIPALLTLYTKVHAHLTTQNKQDEIAPLTSSLLSHTLIAEKIFLLNKDSQTIACAFLKQIPSLLEIYPEENQLVSIRGSFEERKRPWVYVHSVLVDPDWQGRGFGKEFLNKVLERIEEKGTVFLDCVAGNERLRRFYERLGFDLLGVVPERTWEVAIFVREL